MATIEEVEAQLRDTGLTIESIEPMSDGRGSRIYVENLDAVVNLYNTGTCQVQGREADALRLALGDVVKNRKNRRASAPRPTSVVAAAPTAKNEVFVVYGHDEQCRTELEAMLRRWGLEPLILDQLPSEGQTIIEKLEKYQANINFAVVLATPDDIGYRDGHDSEKKNRARQNVVLELGMMLTKLGRSRVAILLKDATSMERPSDIDGLIYLSFVDNVDEIKLTLAKEMNQQGYDISLNKL